MGRIRGARWAAEHVYYDVMSTPVQLESPPCPLCGGAEYVPVLRGARDAIWRKPGIFDVSRCVGCGLVATRPRPTAEGIGFYYENAYSGEAEEGMRRFQTESGLGRLINRYRLGIIQRVAKIGAQDHLLDVGCSYGGFLRVARGATGCQTSGIDLDEGSIEKAVDQDQARYHTGHLVEAELVAGDYSVITFFESLEHHLEPVEALKRAYALLKPGGVCVVEVPNFDGFWRKVFRTAWLPLLIPQHVYHFTPKTLRKSMEAAGFTQVLRQQTLFYPLEGIASFGIWLGRILRSPPLDAKPSWRTPFDILVGLFLLLLFPLVEIPSQALLRLFNASGHQIIVARKPGGEG